jgi:Transposase
MQVETDQGEIIERVAALDVGKAEVVCCARVPGPGGQRMREVRTIPTMTAALLALGDRLAELGVSRVVMEATSDYWRAPFYLLEDRFETWLVNAHSRATHLRRGVKRQAKERSDNKVRSRSWRMRVAAWALPRSMSLLCPRCGPRWMSASGGWPPGRWPPRPATAGSPSPPGNLACRGALSAGLAEVHAGVAAVTVSGGKGMGPQKPPIAIRGCCPP